MATTLIIGPAASGKTERCLQLLLAAEAPPLGQRAWTVVPERSQAVALRRRLARAGGRLGVRIEVLESLVEELLHLGQASRARAGEPIRRRLIEVALTSLLADGEITHFNTLVGKPGFLSVLTDRILELKQARIAPEALRSAAGGDRPDLLDLSQVFDRFQRQLDRLDFEDEPGLMARATQLLQQQPEILDGFDRILVDGFDRFTPAQLAFLAAIHATDCELWISLPGESQADPGAAAGFAQARDELEAALPGLSIETLQPTRDKGRPLRAFERALLGIGDAADGGQSIHFLPCRSPEIELRESLRWLKSGVVRHNVPLHRCALVVSNDAQYLPQIRSIAAEFRVPIRIQTGESLGDSPAIQAVLDFVDLPRLGWPRRLTLDFLRTPFFDLQRFGIDPEAVAKLEGASYWGQVVEGLDQWLQALTRLAQRQPAAAHGEGEEDDPSLPLPTPAQAAELQAALQAIAESTELTGDRSRRAWIEWLEDRLDEFSFFDRLHDDWEKAAGERLREGLRAIVMAESVAGSVQLGQAGFGRELRAALERVSFSPRPDRMRQYLSVLTAEQIRGLRFDWVAVVGLSEGQLPRVEKEDPFLDEDLRGRLGLQPRLGRDQYGLFYQVATRADRAIMFTRSTHTTDGEPRPASPYWERALAAAAVEEQALPVARGGDPMPFEQAVSQAELAFLTVQRGGLPKSFAEFEPELEPVRRARTIIESRTAAFASGPFEGEITDPALAERYGDAHVWSPSRLESYGTCPHMFFAGVLLEFETIEEPSLGPDARQLGSLLHGVLESAYNRADDPSDPEQVLEALNQVGPKAFEQAPMAFGFRPSRLWQVEAAQFLASLEETVRAIAETGTDWAPIGHELRFGIGDAPILELQTNEARLRLRGIIDRVDKGPDGLRVIDYKTGGSHLGKADFVRGRRLQLPIYALAAERALGLGEVVDGFYWALLGGRAGSFKLGHFGDDRVVGEGPQAAYRLLETHLHRIVTGVRDGRFEPSPPTGGCPRYCPAAAWCWRYQPDRYG